MKFTTELGKKICKRTASSSIGLRQICKELNLPYSTVTSWIYDKDHELHDNYQDAKELQLQFLVDEIYEISDNGTNDFMTVAGKNGKSKQVQNRESIARSRLRINARMMVISKLAPILRGRTRHIRGRYEVLDNENTELQHDQDTTAPAAKSQKAVAKQENRAAKNIAGSSPKNALKPAPGVERSAGRAPQKIDYNNPPKEVRVPIPGIIHGIRGQMYRDEFVYRPKSDK
jgi:hypothetical protein